MKTKSSVLAIALACASPLAFANHDTDATQTGASKMDTDNDGTISQQEFMAHQQAMWDKLPKNKDGTVNVSDMQMHHKGMAHKSGVTMQDEPTPGDKAKQDKVKPTDNDGQ
jgi:hypothetical protein